MGIVYPDFKTIASFRVPATPGEWALLNILNEKLNSEFEIFFQPLLDGDHPDIIILRKGFGAIIIEVKDWNLNLYQVDIWNNWSVKKGSGWQSIKSPMAQVFHYKTNLFDLHVPLMGIKKVLHKDIYKVLSPWVYFHEATPKDLDQIYGYPLNELTSQINELNQNFKEHGISFRDYKQMRDNLDSRKGRLQRDRNMSLTPATLEKATSKWLLNIRPNILFTDEIYEDFKRRLSPPEFILAQGNALGSVCICFFRELIEKGCFLPYLLTLPMRIKNGNTPYLEEAI